MNQSEIDAGPPNKKPKIGNTVLSNTVSTSNVLGNVNGLSTQISESTGLYSFFLILLFVKILLIIINK